MIVKLIGYCMFNQPANIIYEMTKGVTRPKAMRNTCRFLIDLCYNISFDKNKPENNKYKAGVTRQILV